MAISTAWPSANGYSRNLGPDYPDPWDDLAGRLMPASMPEAIRWAQSIFMVDGVFREAMTRVASYFITGVEVKAQSKKSGERIGKDEKDKFEEFLTKTLRVVGNLWRVAVDFLCYGNSFTSVVFPFRRYLSCPRCPGTEYPLRVVYETPSFKFRWLDFEFHATCPRCGRSGAWRYNDRPGGPESPCKIKHWKPQEIDILHDDYSDDRAYIWKIPDRVKRQVREGKLFHLERVEAVVIQAVKHGNNILLDPGVLCHVDDPPPSGVDTGGWGLPKAVTNGRQATRVQKLNRHNEVICDEFIMPFRVLSPEARAGGADPASADPVMGTNLASFRAQMLAMIRAHRRDPGRIQVSPVPVHYQIFGAEGNTMAPYQLLDQARDDELNAAGVPAELYKGTLTVQAAPAALRLFEARWSVLVDALNRFVDWLVDRVAERFNWEPVDARVPKATHADDLNRQVAKLQLGMAGLLSQQKMLKSIGENFEEVQDDLVEEQEYVARKQEDMQRRMQGHQQQAQLMQVPAGGMPPPPADPAQQQQQGAPQPAPGGQPGQTGAGMDIQGLWDTANELANRIRGVPESQRKGELNALKRQDRTLHAIVRSIMQDQDQQAETQGKEQVLAQTFGGKRAALPADFSLARLRLKLAS